MVDDAAGREFVERIERHRGILVKVASAYCRDAVQREDLIADIVAQLWSSRKRFDARVQFSTWMYRVALNVAISAFRRQSRQPALLELDAAFAEPAASVAEHDAERELLHEHIERLDPFNRAVVLLYLDERSHAEIGEILGISESNAGTKIARIKRRLRSDIFAAQAISS
jgi:RNA polymerase sigma-70 factor, ECF subfamily